MSSAKLINVNLLKHYHDTMVEEVLTPAVSGVVEEAASKYGHSLSISGTTLSLLDYSGDTLNSITLPSATSISWTNVTGKPSSFTPASHTHGDITDDGKLGSASGKPLITSTDGKIATGSFGSTAGTFCEGNDSRLSDARTPTAHTHNYAGSSSAGGAATSADKLNTDAGNATTPVYFDNGIPKAVTSVAVNVSSASKVTNKLTVSLNGGTTEGTNKFTFDGSEAKTFDITPVGIGAVANGDSRLSDARTPTSHTHGNITNDGKLGTASKPVVTDANKNITTGSFGSTAGTFCEGNDSRLSDARPASDVYAWAKAATKPSYEANEISGVAMATHTHGNVGSDGKLSGASGSLPVMTDADGDLVEGSFGTGAGTFCEGNDSRLSDARTPTAHNQASSTINAMTSYSKASSSASISTSDSLNTAIGKLEYKVDNISLSSIGGAAASHSHVGTEVTLTGYSKASSVSAVAATDTVNAAIGKLEKAIDGKQASGSYLTSSSTLDASKLSGTVPSGCYTNTTYTVDGTYLTKDSNNKISHATGAGYKHIPSGGSSGQILKYSAAGTAVWANEYSYTHPTTAGNKHIPSGGSTGQILVYGGSSGTASWTTPSYAASSHSHVGTAVTLTGYSKASSVSAVAATDTVNAAIGKLEKALDSKLDSSSLANLSQQQIASIMAEVTA